MGIGVSISQLSPEHLRIVRKGVNLGANQSFEHNVDAQKLEFEEQVQQNQRKVVECAKHDKKEQSKQENGQHLLGYEAAVNYCAAMNMHFLVKKS